MLKMGTAHEEKEEEIRLNVQVLILESFEYKTTVNFDYVIIMNN